ncbi:hypothetical protein J8281_03230 [Aquimarina sp. U1-2]|uniref:hypothetical protein n=1 Tax=Aquimarina sp. U1-2 TaxID=2823141 RepID=UPI001AEC9E1A|nr:hypothetical protein [Aquimarina sp. U1-2]MBP2831189.1 hypothetical protein [Aquimarina sp. U1-2]
MNVTKQIDLIRRVDQLVRLQATGTPDELACKLEISKSKLYRIINMMKDFNAPIEYNPTLETFLYKKEVRFSFGFYASHHQHVTAGIA